MSIGIILWVLFLILAVYGYEGIAWFLGSMLLILILVAVYAEKIEEMQEKANNFCWDMVDKVIDFIDRMSEKREK